jgi:hypothetical protein
VTIAQDLADLALRASENPPSELLKTYLLSNLAAFAGANRDAALLQSVTAAISGKDPGAKAYRTAARMHFRTQDDFDPGGRVHAGATIIPPLLALKSSSIVGPMAAGYSVLTCIARAYRDEAEVRGLRPTGVFGPMGAAAAAGIALRLSRAQMTSAIALSTSMCGGTNQSWVDGTDEWILEVAAASRAGTEAALAAAAGARGATFAFEGEAGWSRAFFGEDGAVSLARLISADRRLNEVAIKAYPVSGIAQVATALSATAGRNHQSELPRRFLVKISPAEFAYPGSANKGPFISRSDSLMSVARCCALAYLHGAIPLSSLASDSNPAEQALLDVIDVIGEQGRVEGTAEVSIALKDATQVYPGNGDALLHPTWESMILDPGELARRTEAPQEVIDRLIAALSSDLGADGLIAALGESLE